jgi:hypothetical protein
MAGPCEVLSGFLAAATTGAGDVDGGPLWVLAASPATATIEAGDIDGGPLGVLSGFSAAATTGAEDVDGGAPVGAGDRSGNGYHRSWRHRWQAPWGCCRDFRQWPPPELKTSMMDPLWVLAAGPASATTDVEDIDGGTPGGCWRQVRQRPPSKLEMSMAAPLGVLAIGPAAATTEAGDVDGGALGVLSGFLAAATTGAEDIDGGPPMGAGGRFGSCHHRSWRRRWQAP